MDFYHLIHGFTKLSTTTVNGYCYHYAINDHHSPSLAMCFDALSLCSADLPYIIFNPLHLAFLGVINYRLYLLIHIRLNPSTLLLLILPMQNNKSVKALFTRDVWKNTVLRVGSHANTALGFTPCCICHSTLPLILYFPYITRNSTLTYAYRS